MSVRLIISRADHLVTMVADGKVEAVDLDRLVARLAQEDALSYGKLFDIRGASVDLLESALRMHAGRLSAHGQKSGIGALALVVDAKTEIAPSTLAAFAAAARRPCRTFESPAEAAAWLRTRPGHAPRDIGRR